MKGVIQVLRNAIGVGCQILKSVLLTILALQGSGGVKFPEKSVT